MANDQLSPSTRNKLQRYMDGCAAMKRLVDEGVGQVEAAGSSSVTEHFGSLPTALRYWPLVRRHPQSEWEQVLTNFFNGRPKGRSLNAKTLGPKTEIAVRSFFEQSKIYSVAEAFRVARSVANSENEPLPSERWFNRHYAKSLAKVKGDDLKKY